MKQWRKLDIAAPPDVVRYQRTFPDGTDVILSIRAVGHEYEVVSNAESRTSGPVESTHGRFASVADAMAELEKEARGWDQDLA